MGKHVAIAEITPRLIDEATAAVYVGRSRSAFRDQVARGTLPAHSDSNGNVKLWDVRILDRYVDQRSGLGAPSSGWDD